MNPSATINNDTDYDAIVIGGGPGGSTAAMVLARAGFRVGLFEKETHPRFHIGESILPRNMPLLREIGVEAAMRKLPHTAKYGAEFSMGNDFKPMRFGFDAGYLPGEAVFNIERAPFDKMLLDHARDAGAEVFEATPVTKIVSLKEGRAEVAAADRTFTAKMLIDASGHGTVVGRHLKQRRTIDDPELQKVAYFEHFEGVERPQGIGSGDPAIVMSDEGWFWLIPLNETKTSVGFVTRPGFARQIDVPADRVLQWAIARCPVVRHRMRDAIGETTNRVVADFSYTCAPFAGPGYFMVGDAACFLDPIFSTGVTLAMVSGNEAAKLAIGILNSTRAAASAQREYRQLIRNSTRVFWRLIRGSYRHSFRELFMEGRGPHNLHGAIISTLAGNVFPRPPWPLRWRIRLFECCVWLQQYVALAPRRARFSLISQAPVDRPTVAMPVTT